ncbi:MAG: aspartate aminotransferase family protein [Clostridiales bacterium]|nr:aspartate aminotransferase family protein [Clostridiales bacterium]MCF8022604.1 aspartate aminotransferase family protein [Clostridiales bacterium]
MNSKTINNLFSLEDTIALSRKEIHNLHKQYVNSGLTTLMGMLDFDKHFVEAEGTSIWDIEGNEYVDFLGGYGALNVGHNHPRVLEAAEKIKKYPGILQASLPPLAGALAHNLACITPGQLERTFFCNSGTEAVEGALKLARAAAGKKGLVYCENSFHGKTLGSLSVTGREKYQQPFAPLVPECYKVPFGDSSALEKIFKTITPAAFIVEPVQGEGGILFPPDGYLSKVRDLCSKYEVLLIVDEIQTGLGRTGMMFACEHENIEPDILCLAKSLGGGIIPAGAFMTTDVIWKKAFGSPDKATLHTSTFGGNSRAAAAGLATLEILLQGDLITKAQENGNYFLDKLKKLEEKYDLIKQVRGRGLMIGIEFEETGNLANIGVTQKLSQKYMASLIAAELLNNYKIITAYTLNNPNVIRMEPPLTVSREQIEYVCSSLEKILSQHRGFFSIAASGAKTFLKTFTSKNS